MNNFLLDNEIAIRLFFFFSIFAVMAAWEIKLPKRELTQSKSVRWINNIGLVVLNSFLLRIIFPTAAIGVAFFAQENGWGLFNYWEIPYFLSVVICIVLMDGAIYLQHALMHAIPMFWRLHRMHHTDMDLDVTSGSRFHPIEIILSMIFKFAFIVALGSPPEAVLIFEILLNGSAMFNHSNVQLPEKIDSALRKVIVTPDMHRIHHSVVEHEANTNFGFALSIWDRMFGTYTEQPEAGHQGMTIGISTFRDKKYLTLPWMLAQPFVGNVTAYVLNRRQWKE